MEETVYDDLPVAKPRARRKVLPKPRLRKGPRLSSHRRGQIGWQVEAVGVNEAHVQILSTANRVRKTSRLSIRRREQNGWQVEVLGVNEGSVQIINTANRVRKASRLSSQRRGRAGWFAFESFNQVQSAQVTRVRKGPRLSTGLLATTGWTIHCLGGKKSIPVRKGQRLLPVWQGTQGWSAPRTVADILPPVTESIAAVAVNRRQRAVRLPATRVGQRIAFARVVAATLLPAKELQSQASGAGGTVNTKRIVEALLFAANRPMTIKQLQEAFPEWSVPTSQAIADALLAIAEDYQDRPIGLKELASGYRFQVKDGMAEWVTRLFEEKPPRYSRALLETMAIIAYRQPVTRGEIEDIRGVSVSTSIVQTLLEREWIRVIGHKEVPGRPALYSTTKQFLDYFNLTSLTDLPTLMEIVDLDLGEVNLLPNDQEAREQRQTLVQQDSEASLGAEQTQTNAQPEAQPILSSEIDPDRQLH